MRKHKTERQMVRKVKVERLRRLAQRNMYARGSHCYERENSKKCAEAMVKFGWEHPIWLTQNQIENSSGKYAFNGVCVKPGEESHVEIVKNDHSTPDVIIRTQVYNIDQTNMADVAPGAYELMCQGKSFDEVSDILMHQPLIQRANHGKADEPTGFFRTLLNKTAVF